MSTQGNVDFFVKFRENFKRGLGHVRLDGSPAGTWTILGFVYRFNAVMEVRSPPKITITDRAVRNWLNTENPSKPNASKFAGIVEVFYGETASLEREIFEEAWRALRGDDAITLSDWVVDTSDAEPGLASLDIHIPPLANEPDVFHLQASLALGEWQDQVGKVGLEIYLKNAHLRLNLSACQIDQKAYPLNITWVGKTLRIEKPRNEESGALTGDVLTHDAIATLRRTTQYKFPTVIVEVRSREMDMVVNVQSDEHPVTPLREKLLQKYIRVHHQYDTDEDEEHVIWCRGRLTMVSAS